MSELSDKYLSNIETARSVPSLDVLMKICDALETTPDVVLLDTNIYRQNANLSTPIIRKISCLDKKKQLLLYNFVEWLEAQDIE